MESDHAVNTFEKVQQPPYIPRNLFRPIFTALSIQLTGRCLTFFINTFLITRFIDPRAYGTAHVSFALLETLSLALLREGFRRTALRRPKVFHANEDIGNHPEILQWQKSVLRLSQLGRYVTCFVTVTIALVWFFFIPSSSVPQKNVYYILSVCLVALGVVLSLCVEEKVVFCLIQDPLSRTKAESYSSLGRTISVLVCYASLARCCKTQLVTHPVELGLLSFAVGHVAYGLVWCMWYVMYDYFSPIGITFPPEKVMHCLLTPDSCSSTTPTEMSEAEANASNGTSSAIFSRILPKQQWQECLPEHKTVLPAFCFLAIEKFLLNEAERLTLLMIFPTTEWASYALVSNLAGIVCRLLFSPIEEVATVEFSSTKTASASLTTTRDRLCLYLQVQGTIGFMALCFGPPAASAVFVLLFGPYWVALGAHEVLSVYCWYITLLSINGICEAFMYASASPKWLSTLKTVNPLVSLLGLGVTAVAKTVVDRKMTPTDPQSPVESLYYIYAFIAGVSFSVALRILVVCTFLTCQGFPKKSKTRHDAHLLVATRLKNTLLFTYHLFRPFVSCVTPSLLGGVFLRVFLKDRLRNLIWDVLVERGRTSNIQKDLTGKWLMLKQLAVYELVMTVCVVGVAVSLTITLTYSRVKQLLAARRKKHH